MRLAALIALALVLGMGGGLASALAFSGLLSDRIRLGETIEIDGWRSNWSIGTEAVDPYTKAWVARFGLFALRREEAVYFYTTFDADGEPLREACDYAISVGEQPGSWWSVTVYDGQGYLPQNTDRRLSFDALRAEELQTRHLVLSAAVPEDSEGYWVSTRNAGAFDVTLRVYQPTPEAIESPVQHFPMPPIERLTCNREAQS